MSYESTARSDVRGESLETVARQLAIALAEFAAAVRDLPAAANPVEGKRRIVGASRAVSVARKHYMAAAHKLTIPEPLPSNGAQAAGTALHQ